MIPSHMTNDAIAIAAVVIAIAPHENPNARKRAMRNRAKAKIAKGAAVVLPLSGRNVPHMGR